MGASYGKKRAPVRQEKRSRDSVIIVPQESEGVSRKTCPEPVPDPCPVHQEAAEDLIKPRRLQNPIKNSRTHQQVHRELIWTRQRGDKPELQKVLESRRRDQMIRQRKQEEEAQRKITPLETQLKKRRQRLEELQSQEGKLQQQEALTAPEFLKVRENLRRIPVHRKDADS
ncbi:protein FAM107B-like [Synchiropus picturatus]